MALLGGPILDAIGHDKRHAPCRGSLAGGRLRLEQKPAGRKLLNGHGNLVLRRPLVLLLEYHGPLGIDDLHDHSRRRLRAVRVRSLSSTDTSTCSEIDAGAESWGESVGILPRRTPPGRPPVAPPAR